MSLTYILSDSNHTGLQAQITFSASTGGTFNLGMHTIPYVFESNYPYGSYELFYPQWGQTCTLLNEEQNKVVVKIDNRLGSLFYMIFDGEILNLDFGDGSPVIPYSNSGIEFHDYSDEIAGIYTIQFNSGTATGINFVGSQNNLIQIDATNNQNLISINCTNQNSLSSITIDNSYSISNLLFTSLKILNAKNCSNLSYINNGVNSGIGLVYVDLRNSGLQEGANYDFSNNDIVYFNISGTACNILFLSYNRLNDEQLNLILKSLDDAGRLNGYLELGNQNSGSCLDAQGQSYKNNLEMKGWYVGADIC